MLRVVLTGATGYVGQAILDQLALLPAGTVAVRALVKKDKVFPPRDFVEVIEGNLPDLPGNLFFEEPHLLIHFGIKQVDFLKTGFYETNVLGTHNLLQGCNGNTLGVIYGSTLSIQGSRSNVGVVESELVQPETALERSRAQAEQLIIETMSRDDKWAFCLRPRFILGPSDSLLMKGLILLSRLGVRVGNGDQQYSVITVEDYAQVVVKLSRKIAVEKQDVTADNHDSITEQPIRCALNVAYKRPVSFQQMFSEIRSVKGINNRVKTLPLPVWLPGLIKWIPHTIAESAATQLQSIGFNHCCDVSALEQLLGDDITQLDGVEKLKRLLQQEEA
ncbi:NAD-dependent epimerase/dehydratase family protein [Alkalimarinus alittae]|uniref:NAD(P)-dependent oxidoreductase n=1 Tax=Alkalimarinus alittae TaxID=2961619 RepID=A0ABY6N0H7_9ALTE|nr:NAD(P)-dependent oxidoreductase [Alkalimarinus alittae]UZE95512.1 NAD(P)-dependent oxidoreductase [Alkalimarinus alittae]